MTCSAIRHRLWFVLLGCALATSAPAQGASDDPIRFAQWAVQDVTAAAGQVVVPRTLLVAGSSVAVLLAMAQVDEPVTREIKTLSLRIPRPARLILHEGGNVKMIQPMAVALFLGALSGGTVRFQDAAFTSMQAVMYSNLLTNGVKLMVGRARPSDGYGGKHVSPFSGRRSFPSGHATTALAWVTPWVMYYPHPITYVLAGLSLGTAFMRVADDYHWFSDVLAGAAIGFGTGYLLSIRHQNRNPHVRLSPIAAQGSLGIHLSISLGGGRSE